MISGKAFKSQYPTKKFYKLTTETENHNGFKFKDGLNTDIHPINTNNCSEGGLYFTDENNISRWMWYGNKIMKWIREVEILNDSLIFVENDKYKTDKFILKQKKYLYEDEEICNSAVQQNGNSLKYVKNQTEELCKIAVQQNGNSLKYVENQTEEICKLAVQNNCYAIKHMKYQTEEICKLAVQQNGNSLKFIKNQTEEICKLAAQQNKKSCKYISNLMMRHNVRMNIE